MNTSFMDSLSSDGRGCVRRARVVRVVRWRMAIEHRPAASADGREFCHAEAGLAVAAFPSHRPAMTPTTSSAVHAVFTRGSLSTITK
jgi:hypothetical protein